MEYESREEYDKSFWYSTKENCVSCPDNNYIQQIKYCMKQIIGLLFILNFHISEMKQIY